MSHIVLKDGVVGAKRPAQVISWRQPDGQVENLEGAVISIVIQRDDEPLFFSQGEISVLDGDAGLIQWVYDDKDIALDGVHGVQITASYPTRPTPARTQALAWLVHPYLDPDAGDEEAVHGVLFGRGKLRGRVSDVLALAGRLSGTSLLDLSDDQIVDRGFSGTFSGGTLLSAFLNQDHASQGALTGTGRLSASLNQDHASQGALAGTGRLSVSLNQDHASQGALTGTGRLWDRAIFLEGEIDGSASLVGNIDTALIYLEGSVVKSHQTEIFDIEFGVPSDVVLTGRLYWGYGNEHTDVDTSIATVYAHRFRQGVVFRLYFIPSSQNLNRLHRIIIRFRSIRAIINQITQNFVGFSNLNFLEIYGTLTYIRFTDNVANLDNYTFNESFRQLIFTHVNVFGVPGNLHELVNFNYLSLSNAGLSTSQMDHILEKIYANRFVFQGNGEQLEILFGNSSPSGVYQNASPPTTGNEYRYKLVNDPDGEGFNKWRIN